MRPRPDAAENVAVDGLDQAAGPASMRPRPDAAENGIGTLRHFQPGHASMRPRPDAAENTPWQPWLTPWQPCFNEAAARCRGKQTLQEQIHKLNTMLQ